MAIDWKAQLTTFPTFKALGRKAVSGVGAVKQSVNQKARFVGGALAAGALALPAIAGQPLSSEEFYQQNPDASSGDYAIHLLEESRKERSVKMDATRQKIAEHGENKARIKSKIMANIRAKYPNLDDKQAEQLFQRLIEMRKREQASVSSTTPTQVAKK